MYVTKIDDSRLCNTLECNVMNTEQRSQWRKKVRAINERAKKMNSKCYKAWPFIESKPRTRKISHNSSEERIDLVEVIILI